MRRRSLLPSVVFGAVVLLAPRAHAGTLTSATWFQVTEGRLRGVGVIGGIPMTRTGAQLGAAGTSTATSIAVTLSYPAFASTLFVPKTASGTADLALQVTQGGPQAITATPSMAGGTPGIPGTVVVMSALHAGKGVNQSMFMIGSVTFLKVPLSHGAADQFAGTFIVFPGIIHALTLDFIGWTPHTLVFTGLTSDSQPLPDVTAMGSFALTSMGGGTVTLVSPSKISIDGVVAQRRTVAVTTLVLSFVPEPGTLLLLGGAGLALLLGGRRRRG